MCTLHAAEEFGEHDFEKVNAQSFRDFEMRTWGPDCPAPQRGSVQSGMYGGPGSSVWVGQTKVNSTNDKCENFIPLCDNLYDSQKSNNEFLSSFL